MMDKTNSRQRTVWIIALLFIATCFTSVPQESQASEPFLAEITIFGGNFAPRGWAFCDGQILPISQNQSLFALLGTMYGGDGRTTFALPDLRGRVPISARQGPGLSNRTLGQKGGQENVTLNTNMIPSHSHTVVVNGSSALGNSDSPGGNLWAGAGGNKPDYRNFGQLESAMAPGSVQIGNTGGDQAHDNMPPFQALNYIIAIQGLFPSRN